MADTSWEKTAKRFVVLMDILGFKDLVSRNKHSEVLSKLEIIKNTLNELGDEEKFLKSGRKGVVADRTRSVTFSDTIIFFSKSDTYDDALKIIFDAYTTLRMALNNGIAIKGAISFGEITVDYNSSLFFGQPIIDAYLLHDELQMLTLILDNKVEDKIRTFKEHEVLYSVIEKYKAYLKSGRITHSILKPYGKELIDARINDLEKLYFSTYGRPRIYIDNTLEFLRQIKA